MARDTIIWLIAIAAVAFLGAIAGALIAYLSGMVGFRGLHDG